LPVGNNIEKEGTQRVEVDNGDLIKSCFDWQLDNMKFESWTKKTEGQIGQSWVWDIFGITLRIVILKTVFKLFNQRCNGIQRQVTFTHIIRCVTELCCF
jgi:hypothetical protein